MPRVEQANLKFAGLGAMPNIGTISLHRPRAGVAALKMRTVSLQPRLEGPIYPCAETSAMRKTGVTADEHLDVLEATNAWLIRQRDELIADMVAGRVTREEADRRIRYLQAKARTVLKDLHRLFPLDNEGENS